MRWLAILLLVGCYHPTPPAGVPCSESGDCPANQACIANVCGGTISGVDAAVDAADLIDAIDAPIAIDARPTVAPAYRSVSGDKGNGGTRKVDLPFGIQVGDLLLAHISVDNHNAIEVPTPTGWTRLTELDNGEAMAAIVFYQFVLSSNQPATDWTLPGTGSANDNAVFISAYSGVDPSAPINAVDHLAMSTTLTPSTPSLVTTVANTRLVALFTMDNTDGPLAPAQGATEMYQDLVTGTGLLFEGSHAAFAGPGTAAPMVASLTDSGLSIGILIALTPR